MVTLSIFNHGLKHIFSDEVETEEILVLAQGDDSMESLCQYCMLVRPVNCRILNSCSPCTLIFSVVPKSMLGDYIHTHINDREVDM